VRCKQSTIGYVLIKFFSVRVSFGSVVAIARRFRRRLAYKEIERFAVKLM